MVKIVTHNGTYHADDVFAVATLLIVEPEAEIIRTRDEKILESADYVVDVGLVSDPTKKRFDHHQLGGAGKRDNGIQYASFGLVWKEFGEKIAEGKEEADIIDKALVQPIDAHDNGMPLAEYFYEDVRYFTIVDFLYSFILKNENTDEEIYETFLKVVAIAKDLLTREVEKAKNTISSQRKVRELYESSVDKRVIVLDKEYSWTRVLTGYSEPLFVIYPRNDGKWLVKAVPASSKIFGTYRKPFPANWAGKNGDELSNVSGVEDAFFVHRNLFLAVSKSKEGAIELAHKAINT